MSTERIDSQPLGLWLSERVYGLALYLYPRQFRRQYADDMMAVVRHRWLRRAGTGGSAASFRVWWLLLKDLSRSVPAERRAARRQRRGQTEQSGLSSTGNAQPRMTGEYGPEMGTKRGPEHDPEHDPRAWSRRSSVTEWLSSVVADTRFALRGFRSAPGFTAIAVATLALGIGANSAIFSVVHGVVIRPLPFPESSRIVRVAPTRLLSAQQVVGIGEQTSSYLAASAVGNSQFTLVEGDTPEVCTGAVVGAGHLQVFGVPPLLGREFREEDSQPGSEPVAMISHGLWVRAFASDPEIVGRTVRLEGEGETVRTIVGVLPAGYEPFTWQPDVFAPIVLDVGTHDYEDNHRYWLLARLRPDVSLTQARAELRMAIARLAAGPERMFLSESAEEIDVVTLHESRVGDVRGTLWIILAAVGVVLLIACTNVANLMLARAGARQREFAIRAAIGAGRGRVARQVLTESILLGVIGGSVGLLAALAGQSGLTSILPADIPQTIDLGVDVQVLVFTLGLSILSGLAFGLVPAVRLSGSLEPALRQDAAGAGTIGRGRHRLNAGLVVAEIALSVVLVAAAGLLVKSLWVLQQVDPGFTVERLYALHVTPSLASYPGEDELRLFYRQILEQVEGVPGVTDVGAINARPLSRGALGVTISTDGSPVPEDVQAETVSYRVVTPGYVETMEIPLIEGRTLTDADRAETVPVGMVNSALANWLWPDESAIGKLLAWSDGSPWFTVVGVVGNVHQNTLSAPSEPEVYVPYEQESWLRTLYLMVRAESDWNSLAAVREAVRSVDRTVPISNAGPMWEVAGSSMATPRAYTLLFSLLALLALGLGAVGVFGVLSYTMSQRTHEIGVRIALGATRRDVVRTAMRSGLTPVAIGLLLGLVAALASTHLVSGLLFGVAATDPGILVGVVVVLGTVATLAGLIPALRAAKVDPARSLRQD